MFKIGIIEKIHEDGLKYLDNKKNFNLKNKNKLSTISRREIIKGAGAATATVLATPYFFVKAQYRLQIANFC